MIEQLERRLLFTTGQLVAGWGNGARGYGNGVTELGEIGYTGSASSDALPDGRILVASAQPVDHPDQLLLQRVLGSSGAPDPSFGGTGGQPPGSRLLDLGKPVTAVGELTIVGDKIYITGDGGVLLVRLNLDGSLDPSFGGAAHGYAGEIPGVARVQVPDFPNFQPVETGVDIAVARDGRIAVAVTEQITDATQVVMFRPDGTLDASFDGDGILQLPLDSPAGFLGVVSRAFAVAFAGDGTLIVGGAETNAPGDGTVSGRWELRRLSPQGQAIWTTKLDPDAFSGSVFDLTIVAGDKILAAGGIHSDLTAARFDLASGMLDPTFGVGGVARLNNGSDDSSGYTYVQDNASLAVLPDGRFYVAADVYRIASGDGEDRWSLILARFDAAGETDPSFNNSAPNLSVLVEAGQFSDSADQTKVILSGIDPVVQVATSRVLNPDGGKSTVRLHKFYGGGSVVLTRKGTLLVRGGAGDDEIFVRRRHRDGRIVAGFASAGGFVRSFAPARVKRIQVFAAEGNDTVTIGVDLRGAFIDAGAGNDLISTAPTRDTLVGGDGNDQANDDPSDLYDGIEMRTA
jgi:uncharacterized delta-60 repeat protein